jgi:predicted Zn-dependent peptidase
LTLKTHRTVFPNGFTLLVREDRAAPVVAIVTRVKAGYFDEPDSEIGIAHVLEHMYFKGTPTRLHHRPSQRELGSRSGHPVRRLREFHHRFR